MPFVALLCYARLLSISPELYEAAQVDGAARLAAFPGSRSRCSAVLLIALLFRTLDALRAFDIMFVLTGGGPASTTETAHRLCVPRLFQTLQLGLGSAIGVIVFLLVMLVAWAYVTMLRRDAAAR